MTGKEITVLILVILGGLSFITSIILLICGFKNEDYDKSFWLQISAFIVGGIAFALNIVSFYCCSIFR